MFVSLSIYISQKLKYMDILLVIGVICLLVGLAGVLPILPGAAGSVFGFSGCAFTGYAEFTVTELVVWGLLVVLVQAMDYVTPMLGTKYSGEGPSGKLGMCRGEPSRSAYSCFTALGNLLGPFIGAFVGGNFLGGKASGDALKG